MIHEAESCTIVYYRRGRGGRREGEGGGRETVAAAIPKILRPSCPLFVSPWSFPLTLAARASGGVSHARLTLARNRSQ